MALDGWKEKLFQRYLVWSCRPERVRSYLLNTVKPDLRSAQRPLDRKVVRAAALQLELQFYKSPLDYAAAMHHRLAEAVERGANLVSFPEYNSLHLLGLLPGFEAMEEAYREQDAGEKPEGSAKESAAEDLTIDALFRYMSPIVKRLVPAIYGTLAHAYGIYVMAGSYILADGGNLVNRSFLFGPDGKLVGSHDKVHLMVIEKEWDLVRGSSFPVYDTALGRLALPVCMDATYYETFRAFEAGDADIALLPIANMESYNYWLALRGVWPRVQESPVYGVKSALVGSVAGMQFTGRAGIFAPLELTPREDGILDEVEPFDKDAIALADLNLEALHELKREHPWRDRNPALYKRYFPRLYLETREQESR